MNPLRYRRHVLQTEGRIDTTPSMVRFGTVLLHVEQAS
jgi:hypothetical protein